MTQSADLTAPRLEWADRGMVQYLYQIGRDSTFNTQLCKVYYQSGEIHVSIHRHAENYASMEVIKHHINKRKEYLRQKVAEYVARRLDNALQGET